MYVVVISKQVFRQIPVSNFGRYFTGNFTKFLCDVCCHAVVITNVVFILILLQQT